MKKKYNAKEIFSQVSKEDIDMLRKQKAEGEAKKNDYKFNLWLHKVLSEYGVIPHEPEYNRSFINDYRNGPSTIVSYYKAYAKQRDAYKEVVDSEEFKQFLNEFKTLIEKDGKKIFK